MCVQPGFVKGTEGTALGGLHSKPATVWSYVPASSPWAPGGKAAPTPHTLSLRSPPPPHLHRSVQKRPVL